MKKFAHYLVFPLFILLFHLICKANASGSIPGVEISMPPSIAALSGDLHIQIISSSFPPLAVQLSRLEGLTAQPLLTFPVFPEASALKKNSTILKIKCGYFSRGGQYYIQLKKQPIGTNTTIDSTESNTITRSLDVRWPMPQLTVTPEHVQTYPETPVSAILTFPEVVCAPLADNPASAIPEFWLELRYCGHSLLTCDSEPSDQGGNKTGAQVLYSEQVRGFPGHRVYTLRCELFGLAGHYALILRPTNPTPSIPNTVAYIKADWSEQFVFNVHARSIFPCDGHSGGITVLFQYPSCILGTGDRVRLFARLRANVESLAPPTTLEYVAEQRVTRGQHSLHFSCDLFTERYVEYCFVYVSQAITGAVADVRMDCVPTLPVTEQESGGWGPWSEWTSCSSTCVGGIRSRYRFCDSPPPRYGAKFCDGQAVETQKCGINPGNDWECFYGSGITGNDVVAEIPEVQAEVGPYCRCGCVVHLGQAKPKRLLATSSQSCPGRTFWLIQADDNCIVQFKVEQFYLPCGNQWLKVRDGSSLSSNLLADLSGEPDTTPSLVNSTGSSLLLEFYSEDFTLGGQLCSGGFLAHAIQLKRSRENITEIPAAQSVGVLPVAVLKLTAVHIATIFFLSGLIIATTLLGAQYLFRYRKYHVAQAEDQDSLGDPNASNNSLPLATRTSSNATLLSEVISLTRLRPLHMKTAKNKHVRLRESVDCDGDRDEEHQVTLAKEEDSLSGSTTTLTIHNESTSISAVQSSAKDEITPTYSLPVSPQLENQRALRRSSTINSSEKDKSNEKDDTEGRLTPKEMFRRLSNVSTATLTNGCYSSAASMVSTATIRSTNGKAAKDKKNREKVLAGPVGSEFSIAGPDVDLEMDYYDYNVVNAGAAPGSYLGMDPAFLVWIPPIDESGEILPQDGIPEYHEMDDIRPKVYIDPGSNKESPEEETLLPKPIRSRSISEGTPRSSPIMRKHKRIHPLVLKQSDKSVDNRYLGEDEPFLSKTTTIQLHEYPNKLCTTPKLSKKYMEKETKVEKSPSVDSTIFDELKFADDEDEAEDEDLTETMCNIENVSYQDSNVLSS